VSTLIKQNIGQLFQLVSRSSADVEPGERSKKEAASTEIVVTPVNFEQGLLKNLSRCPALHALLTNERFPTTAREQNSRPR
jgi:hypothetical protein